MSVEQFIQIFQPRLTVSAFLQKLVTVITASPSLQPAQGFSAWKAKFSLGNESRDHDMWRKVCSWTGENNLSHLSCWHIYRCAHVDGREAMRFEGLQMGEDSPGCWVGWMFLRQYDPPTRKKMLCWVYLCIFKWQWLKWNILHFSCAEFVYNIFL